jgi:hypothetical protein
MCVWRATGLRARTIPGDACARLIADAPGARLSVMLGAAVESA